MILGGYTGRIPYIDLATGGIDIRTVTAAEYRMWLGGSGLGAMIFTELCQPDTSPLSPANPLIFMTGPMTGTNVPGSGRHQVVSKSPLTGIYGEADAGGQWGTELKKAGFDGLVITGRAEQPVYVHIRDGEIKLHDASQLWGLDTYDADEALKDIHGSRIATAGIGPAGENLVPMAVIIGEGRKGRSSGRGGLGAVMGSKNLKAIAVEGSRPVPVYDEAGLQDGIEAVAAALKERTGGLQHYGTAGGIIGAEMIGSLPVKNWSGGSWPDAEKISGQKMAETIVKGTSKCHACPVACGRTVKIDGGAYGSLDGKGPEFETLGMFGGACLISDLEAIAAANELCNRYGIDTISAGGSIAFLMDMYEQGRIDPSGITDSDDRPFVPQWGDGGVLIRLIHAIGRGAGIGALLGQGVRRAAQMIGGGAEDYAFHVKGLEMPAHDPRAFNSLALGYATSNRGACHLQGGSYFFEKSATLPEIGITEILDRFRADNQGAVQARLQDTMCIMDSLKLCKFLFYGGINLTIITDWYNSLTGQDLTVEELLTAGERIFNLKRQYNVACGISRADDTLPRRIAEVPRPDGGAAGNLPPLADMLAEYYQARGWDSKGRPLAATLARLGLCRFAYKNF